MREILLWPFERKDTLFTITESDTQKSEHQLRLILHERRNVIFLVELQINRVFILLEMFIDEVIRREVFI